MDRKKSFCGLWPFRASLRASGRGGHIFKIASLSVETKPKKGFTLIEVALALAILAVTLSGLLLTYVSMFVLTDMQRDHALASNALLARLEEIRAMGFDDISTAAGSFNLTDYGFPANQSSRGRVDVVTSFSGYPATLTKVRLVACYATRLNRTVGEDRNFNGVLDSGEDVNNNSRIDSAAEVVSLIAK
jgi:prepilin-type N-terminal cleavage/methylation domain-containing protein